MPGTADVINAKVRMDGSDWRFFMNASLDARRVEFMRDP